MRLLANLIIEQNIGGILGLEDNIRTHPWLRQHKHIRQDSNLNLNIRLVLELNRESFTAESWAVERET